MSDPETISLDPGREPARPGRWRRLRAAASRIWRSLPPSPNAKHAGALPVLLLTAAMAAFVGVFTQTGLPGMLGPLSGILFTLFYAGIIFIVAALAIRIVSIIPRFFSFLSLTALVVFLFAVRSFASDRGDVTVAGLAIALLWVAAGGVISSVIGGRFRAFRVWKKVYAAAVVAAAVSLTLLCALWIASRGTDRYLVKVPKTPPGQIPAAAPGFSDPSLSGPFKVLALTYGSGKDKHRPEFGAAAALKTESVDAGPFLKNNKGWRMKLRRWFWGFDFKSFPLNGRVWYPDGAGPFPLVLIVHGNHTMTDYSDPGYEYLGRLLASRGFIFVSVDENFFNGGFMSWLQSENDGRAWLLLQHLKTWKKWNGEAGNPFTGKVDMDRIALMGHSRGGEAALVAACFNTLKYYPDDATVPFDFGFSIRAVVAIAPIDGQYYPAGRPTPLANVDYLVIQGAHDADVSFFSGDRAWKRVHFTDGKDHFKASVYAYRANHGQFNSVWGNKDSGMPSSLFLNRKPLLDAGAQRKIAAVYISSFLEAALHGDRGFARVLEDERSAAKWLPEDIYVTRYQDASFRTVADFEEDVDLTTASLKGAVISGTGLAAWREVDLPFRKGGTKVNQVTYLGWREPEKGQAPKPGVYAIELPDTTALDWRLDASSALCFSLADADEVPPAPEKKAGEKEEAAGKGKAKEAGKAEGGKPTAAAKKAEEKPPLDLSVEVATSDGVRASLPLSRFRSIPPVLKSRFTKFRSEGDWYGKDSEVTLQTFELPLAVFMEAFPDLDPAKIKTIHFVFDRGGQGTVALDDVGFAHLMR